MSDQDWTCWRDLSHRPVTKNPLFGWPQCSICRAAPAYHERSRYLPDGFRLNVYVPADGRSTAIIAPGSAVVGLITGVGPEGGWVSVYYEGWLNGPMQYGDRDARGLWEAGLLHAADRMVTDYPTIAQARLPLKTLRKVGTYNPKTHEVTVNDEEALTAWVS